MNADTAISLELYKGAIKANKAFVNEGLHGLALETHESLALQLREHIVASVNYVVHLEAGYPLKAAFTLIYGAWRK